MVTGTADFELISYPLVATIMPRKRSTSKETTESNTDEVVGSTPVTIPILSDTQLFIEKDSNITCHMVKDAFTPMELKADLEDR